MSEKPWEFPDLEQEMAKRRADLAAKKLNDEQEENEDLYPNDRHRLVRLSVDHENWKRHERGFDAPDRSVRPIIEWQKCRFYIDELPGIPKWRILNMGTHNETIVRVGTMTDKRFQLEAKEEEEHES